MLILIVTSACFANYFTSVYENACQAHCQLKLIQKCENIWSIWIIDLLFKRNVIHVFWILIEMVVDLNRKLKTFEESKKRGRN